MKRLKNFLCKVGYALYFIGGFYVIFVNFLTPPDTSTKVSIIRSLFLAISMGIYFPSLICLEFHTINNLEKEIDKLENELSPQSHKDNF